MNCKQGDLAIIVRSFAGNEGKIVRCLKFIPSMKWRQKNGPPLVFDSWETDFTTAGWGGDVHNKIQDRQLRPIRPTDGEDEMLRIAGKPERMTA